MKCRLKPFINEISIIECERFLLRGMTGNDVEDIFVFMSDHETMKYITPTPVQSQEEMKENIQKSLYNFEMKKEIPWVIVNKVDDDVIGMFRFHKLHFWHKKTEMGVVIRKDFQNKGVMTEILPKVLSFGFHTLGLNRIVGDIFANNKASERLLLKYGFTKEGQLRQTDFDGEKYHDTVVFSMLKHEFMKRVN